MIKRRHKKQYLALFLIIIATGIISFAGGTLFPKMTMSDMENMDTDEQREVIMGLNGLIHSDLILSSNYRCCLEEPCSKCITKSPGHGEGATCSCLKDIMEGVHPCGECIGEILEGHGNEFLAPYFATAIAEKTGELEAIQRIILEKYGTPLEDQI